MCIAEDPKVKEYIEGKLLDEKSSITFKTLSSDLNVSITNAKNILSRIKHILGQSVTDVDLIHCISGINAETNFKEVAIVSGTALEATKSRYSAITNTFVYGAKSKFSPYQFEGISRSEDIIKHELCEREIKTESARVYEKKTSKEATRVPENVSQGSAPTRSESKEATSSLAKEPKTSKGTSMGSSKIASMFSKAESTKRSKGSTKQQDSVKREREEEELSLVDVEGGPDNAVNSSGQLAHADSASKESGTASKRQKSPENTTDEEVDVVGVTEKASGKRKLSNKNKDAPSSATKKPKKAKSKTGQTRKRIVKQESDSEDDIFADDSTPAREPTPPKEEEEEPPALIPLSKTIVKTTVQETYTDEDGFIHTVKRVATNLELKPIIEQEEKPKPKPVEKKDEAPAKKGAKKKAAPSNQPSLFNFFKKK